MKLHTSISGPQYPALIAYTVSQPSFKCPALAHPFKYSHQWEKS